LFAGAPRVTLSPDAIRRYEHGTMMSDEKRAVMITGASRGLGRALAMEFASRGHPVGLCAREAAALQRVAADITSIGGRCMTSVADVADPTSVARWVEDTEDELGAPGVLINNASVLGSRVPLGQYPVDDWRHTIDINLNGTFIVSRAVLPRMLAAGSGSIINVSSGAAIAPRQRWGAYAVSKAAVEVLTMNLAAELQGTGVRVNAVDPGAMRTEMRASAYPDEDPGDVKTPREATAVFLWLASADSTRFTGRRFSADRWRDEIARP
jgi:NAD(P)-dependent dehydrogenase (short-subunit alcohol dehydrogenase family)